MIRLEVLGPLHVTDAAGRSLRTLVTQPKRLALLVHLTIAGGFRRRDQLLAMFWPELDTAHARGALSQAVRFLRRELGSSAGQVVISRGNEDLGVDPAALWCDAVAFSASLRERQYGDALELYRGDLLEGFFVSAGPAFDDWVTRERERLRDGAVRAARALAEELEADEHYTTAVANARRAFELSHLDERAMRELLELLDRLGDRAAALHAYDEFARRLARELDTTPSPETVAVMERIRAGSGQRTVRLKSPGSASGSEATSAEPAEFDRWRIEGELARGGMSTVYMARDARNNWLPWKRGRHVPRGWLMAGVVGISAIGAAAAYLAPGESSGEARPRVAVRHEARPRVAVRPLFSVTQDPALAEALGVTISDSIAASLATLQTVEVVPIGQSNAKRQYTVGGSYRPIGDSIEFTIEIVDNARNRALPSPWPVRVGADRPLEGVDAIRGRALGALAYYTSPFGVDSIPERRPPTYDAYLAFDEGLAARLRSDWDASEKAFRRTIALDPTYTEAYFLLSATFANQTGRAQMRGGIVGRFEAYDSLAREMRRAIATPTAADRYTIDWLERYAAGDVDGALDAVVRLGERMPAANYNVGFMGVLANRPSVGLRGLERLDPNVGWTREAVNYWIQVAACLHQSGRYPEELRATKESRARFPRALTVLNAELRARIGLGEIESLSLQDLQPIAVLRLALELRAHGHTQRSREWLTTLVDTPTTADIPFPDRVWVAMALLALDRLAEATTMLERSVQLDTLALDQRGMLGTAYARLGRRSEALRISEELAAVKEPYLQGLPTLWRAKIAARLGDRETAVDLLARAFDEGVIYHPNFPSQRGTVWHSDPDFESLRGYRRYDDLARPR